MRQRWRRTSRLAVGGAASIVAAAAAVACFEGLQDPVALDGGAEPAEAGDASSLVDATATADANADASVNADATVLDAAEESTVVDAGPYASAVLGDHPLAYWRFDEPDSATTAADFSGNGNVLTFVGAPVSRSVPGALAHDPDTALAFVEASGMVSYADGGPIFAFFDRAAFSIEGWIKPSVLPSPVYWQILGRAFPTDDVPDAGYLLSIDSNDQPAACLLFERIGGTGARDGLISCNSAGEGGALAVNVWRHFVITYDGTTISLYLDDGALSYSHASAAELTGTSLFTVGGTLGNFLGTIHELAVYGYALDGGSVAAHYAAATR